MEFLAFDSLAGEKIAHKFKPGDNVLSIKGFAVDRIKVMCLSGFFRSCDEREP